MKGGTLQTTIQTKDSGGGTATKPTAEQIRYAQLLNSSEDQKRLQEQIRQVADFTGRNPDDVCVALHDCNFDTEQTINSLLEGRFDQGEWKVTSSRKKKPQTATTSQGIDSIIPTNTTLPTSTKSSSRPSRGGGKNSGKNRQSNESSNNDHVNGHMKDNEKPSGELGRGRGTREDRWSGERRPGGRGGFRSRGGMSGRGGGRPGRSFGSRGRPNRSSGGGRGFVNSPQTDNLPLENGTERWDSVDEDNKKSESWDTKPSEDWGAEEWTPSIPEVSAASTEETLFNSVPSSSSWPDHPQDSSTSWDAELDVVSETKTYNKSENTDPYSPEDVDMAVIHSKLARTSQLSSSPGSVPGLPVPPIPLPGQISAGDMDAISKLLEKAGRNTQDQSVSVAPTSQLQTQTAQSLSQRQPRGNRAKRTQKSQIPDQAVEMPGSMADSLDVQFGNLEFGGDSVASPKKQETPVAMPSVEEDEVLVNSDPVSDSHLDMTSQHSERANQHLDLTNQTNDITSSCRTMGSQPQDLTSQLHGVQHCDLTSERGIDQLGTKSQLNESANQHCNIASLATSLSITSPAVSVATTASASSSVSTHDESSQRHFQHASPRDRQAPHISKISRDSIPLPSSKLVSRESVLPTKQSVVADRSPTPPSLQTGPSISSSLSSGPRSQPSPSSGALTQLTAVPTCEATMDSRNYQHGVNQTSISSKDQLSSVIDSSGSLGSSVLTSSVQRNELSRTEPTIPPPPGVSVPSYAATHGHTTAVGSLSTVSTTTGKPVPHTSKPSFPPGVLPLNHLYGVQQGLIHAYPMAYGYDDLQRLPVSPYYDMQFQSTNRGEALAGTYQGDQKFGRSDASSPVSSTLSQAVTPGQPHLQQQAFINATMSPYGYGGLAFYPGAGMMAGGFPPYQPPPVYQMPTKTHGSASQYQTPGYNSQHGSHNFGSSGYDDLGSGHDFGKSGGYHSTVSQSQSKSTSGSVASPSTDLSGTTYKGQQFNDSKAFLGGTPPPALNLPVAGQHGHLNTGFPPGSAPFLSLMAPAQQPHHPSLFHHHHMSHQHLETGQSASSHSQRGQQSQSSKQSQSKGHQPSVYQQTPFWSGTN